MHSSEPPLPKPLNVCELPPKSKFDVLLPWLWNRKCRIYIESVLNNRNLQQVKDQWAPYVLNDVQAFLIIQKLSYILGWRSNLFLPYDTCKIFFRYYEKKSIDGLEDVQAFLYIQEISGEDFNKMDQLLSMTLADFFKTFKSCSIGGT